MTSIDEVIEYIKQNFDPLLEQFNFLNELEANEFEKTWSWTWVNRYSTDIQCWVAFAVEFVEGFTVQVLLHGGTIDHQTEVFKNTSKIHTKLEMEAQLSDAQEHIAKACFAAINLVDKPPEKLLKIGRKDDA